MTYKGEDGSLTSGLRPKTSKNSGSKYLNGQIEIDGKGYRINLFKNTKKNNPQAPTHNLVLRPKEEQTPVVLDDETEDDLSF